MNAPRSSAANLTPPTDLTEVALDFWQTYAPGLADAGLLTDQDRPAFERMCRIWEAIKTLEPRIYDDNKTFANYIALDKRLESLAKQFCMVPVERRRQAIAFTDALSRHDKKEGFEF